MARRIRTTASKPEVARFAAPPSLLRDGLTEEIATHRLLQWLKNLPDPDEVLKKAGISRANLRAVEASDEVSQALETRREAVISTPWRLEPNQSRAGKWLTAELEPHMETLLRTALDAVGYGYSVAEVVYRPAGGRIGIERISAKPLEWFVPRHDGLFYYPDDGTGGYEGLAVLPEKFLLTVRQPTYRNPYGEALLSRLYWPVFFLREARRNWAQFLERFGNPILVGKVMDAEAYVAAVQKLGLTTPLAIPETSEVKAITASQAGEFERFHNVMERTIQKVVLGQTLTSDVGDKGSFAAAKVHNEVRDDKRRADIRLVSATVQRLVNFLGRLNGFDAPRFVMADDTGLEMERAQRDALLVEKGILRLTEDYLLDRYDYQEGDFEIPEAAPPPVPAAPPGEPDQDKIGGKFAFPNEVSVLHTWDSNLTQTGAAQDRAVAEGDADPTPVTAYTEQLAQKAGGVAKVWLDTIRTRVGQADSLETLRDDLLGMYGHLPTEDLVEVMGAAFACADLAGRFDVSGGG